MTTKYNLIAGQSLERLTALSDGIFAVAMTLLVLDLHVPVSTAKMIIDSDLSLWHALVHLAPNLLTYFMSFMTLGIFWVGQQTQLHRMVRSDRSFAWIHLGFLLVMSLMPFSTGLLAAYITFRIPLVIYWFNILLAGTTLYLSWRYALRAGLVSEETTEDVSSAIQFRIVMAQVLYAFGALLCLINTYASIVFIVLVQLNYVIAPRVRLLYRL